MTTTLRNAKLLLPAIAVLGALFLAPAAQAGRFEVSPPKFDFTVNPGAVLRNTVNFTNKTGADVVITPDVLNFTYREGDEVTGSPDTYPADDIRTGTELAHWVEMDREPVLVPNGATHSFVFTIVVPEDAQPGGHFGMIELLATHPGAPSGVGVTGGTGSLIFMRVEGETRDELNVERFHADDYSYRHLPVNFIIRIENTGNTHLRPVGNIFIKNMLGRQVASLTVNPQFRTVLPGSARRFDLVWEKKPVRESDSALRRELKNFAFGKYEATLFLNYAEGKVVSKTVTFWVIPWLALALWTGIAAAAIIILVFGLKAYNKAVIRRYEKKMKKN